DDGAPLAAWRARRLRVADRQRRRVSSANAADIDLRPLAWARAAIGALLLLRTTPLLAPLDIWFLRDAFPLLGWPDAGWSATPGLFALPAIAVKALCVLRTLGALALMLGVW